MTDTNIDTTTDKPIEQPKVSVGREQIKPKPVEKPKFLTVKTVNKELYTVKYESDYPFSELEVGGAFFVPNKDKTTEQNSLNMHKEVAKARDFYSEVEVDEDGDEVWETVIVKNTTRNPDGTIKLQADGTPIVGANAVTRPNLINFRHFVIYPVIKDYDLGGQKAPEDGVLIVRVY